MALVDVKYIRAENLTPAERAELGITLTEGLVAVETTNPNFEQKGFVIENYVKNLLNLGK